MEIEEKITGRSCNGESNWEITIPESTEIKFNSASGNIEINAANKIDINTASGDIKINAGNEIDINTASGDMMLSGLNGRIKINSASGDISLMSSKGKLNINTASGNVSADRLSGAVKINAASGDININSSNAAYLVNAASGNINADNIVINAESEFTSATGHVKLSLEKSTAFDLTLSSASGNSTLDYKGNSLNGYYEFSARVKKGRIVSPVKFDKEEIIEKHGKKYNLKSFTIGKLSPIVRIKTASGTSKLIK